MKSNQELIELVKAKVACERDLGIEILHLLFEIEVRKVHLILGFPSLHEFCVRELKYTDGAAFRRIKAMRLLHTVPKVEEKLKNGALSFSAAASVQNYFQQQRVVDPKVKRDVISQVENKSTREVEKVVAELSGAGIKAKLAVDDETFQMLRELQALLSHQPAAQNLGSLVKKLVGEELVRQKRKRFGKLEGANREARCEDARRGTGYEGVRENGGASPEQVAAAASAPELRFANPKDKCEKPTRVQRSAVRSRSISSGNRRVIFRRDQACTYVCAETGKRCGSTWQLEIDHIHQFALGGGHEPENLRVLCDAHNRLRN